VDDYTFTGNGTQGPFTAADGIDEGYCALFCNYADGVQLAATCVTYYWDSTAGECYMYFQGPALDPLQPSTAPPGDPEYYEQVPIIFEDFQYVETPGAKMYVEEVTLGNQPDPGSGNGGNGGGFSGSSCSTGTCKAPTEDNMALRVNEYARRVFYDRLLTFPKTDHMVAQFAHVMSVMASGEKYPHRPEVLTRLWDHLGRDDFSFTGSSLKVLPLNATGFWFPRHAPVVEGNVEANGALSLRRVCIEEGSSLVNGMTPSDITFDINSGRYDGRCNIEDPLATFSVGSSWNDFVLNVVSECGLSSNYILSLVYDVDLMEALLPRISGVDNAEIELDTDGTDHFLNVPLLGSIVIDHSSNPSTFSIHEDAKTSTGTETVTVNFS
jgi:hypothetical protein